MISLRISRKNRGPSCRYRHLAALKYLLQINNDSKIKFDSKILHQSDETTNVTLNTHTQTGKGENAYILSAAWCLRRPNRATEKNLHPPQQSVNRIQPRNYCLSSISSWQYSPRVDGSMLLGFNPFRAVD